MRRLLFSIGVILGLVAPQAAPELAAKALRQDAAIVLNAAVDRAFPEGALELAAEGSEVAFEVEARVEGRTDSVRATRSLRFDASKGEWVVGFGGAGKPARLKDREAAVILASSVWALPICGIEALEGGGSIVVTARPGILDDGGAWHPAGILWGYVEPTTRLSFASAAEVPR